MAGDGARSVVWVELESTDEPAPAAHGRARPGPAGWRWWLAVAGVIGAGAGALVMLDRDGHGDRWSRRRELLPNELVERWTARVDARQIAQVVGTDEILVAVVGPEPALVGLDAASGAELWRTERSRDAAPALLSVIDRVVLAQSFDPDGEGSSVAALDLASGERRWTRRFAADKAAWTTGSTLVVGHFSGDDYENVSAVETLDPATGRTRAELSGGRITVGPDSAVRATADTIEVFDYRSQEVVRQIDLAEVPDQSAELAEAVAGGAVVLGGERLTLVDDHGDVVAARTLDEFGRPVQLFRVDGSDDHVVVQSGASAQVLATTGGELRSVWSARGWVVDALMTDGGGPVLFTFDPSGAEGEAHIVDAETGEELAAGAPRSPYFLGALYGNGFLDVDERDPTPAVTARRLDGSVLWTRRPEQSTDFFVAGGAFFESRTDGSTGETLLTMFAGAG